MKNLLLILALFVGNIFSLDYIVCDIEEDYFSDKLKKEYGAPLSKILDSNEKYSEIFIELEKTLSLDSQMPLLHGLLLVFKMADEATKLR